ncbi:MAG: hypothetical protein Q9212_002074 [Teloschistes hypoglaucus]
MSNTNGNKRAWVPDEDTQWTYKRARISPPQQRYIFQDRTRDHRQTPQRPSSPTSHASEDSEDRELAKLEAELAKRRLARQTRRDRGRAKRSPMLLTQPWQPNTHAQTDYRGTQHNAYGLSQHDLGDDTLYGSADTGYGTSVAGSLAQPVHGPHVANTIPSYRAAGQHPRRQPTTAPPRRPQAVHNPPYLPGPTGDYKAFDYQAMPNPSPRSLQAIDPSLNSYLDNSVGSMPNLTYDARVNALGQPLQPSSGIPDSHQPYFPQAGGPYFPPSRKRARGDDEASPEEPSPKTKRQKRLARGIREGKDMGSDNKEKGQIRFDEHGNMMCCIDFEWLPAVYHHDRRERLLELAEQNGRLQYTYDQVHGLDSHDRTAYHPSYVDVNMKERNGRPRILYMWDPPTHRAKCERDPGYMVDPDDNNVVLIDKNNHPIRNHKELPVVISGQVPGVWMELWRRMNPNITNADIVARTPDTTCLGVGKKHHALTQQAFNNRTRRDRVLLGTRAWSEREGSEQIQAQLRAIMPARVLRELKGRGTTADWRDLTNEEITAVVSVNRGRGSALLRAGARRLDKKTKGQRDGIANARDEAVLARLMREKRREDEKDGLQGIEAVPAGHIEQQNFAEEGSMSDSTDGDRSLSEDWSERASNSPTRSEIDAAEAERRNDATLVESEFGEGDTLVQPADLDKDGNPARYADKKESGDDDRLDAPAGAENTYQYQHPSAAGGTRNANLGPPIIANQWIGDGYIRPIDFSSLGYSTEDTGANAAQVAGAVEEEPAYASPSDSEGGVDIIQPLNTEPSGTQDDAVVARAPASPPHHKDNLDNVQDLDPQGDSEFDFSEYLNSDDQAAINAFLEGLNGGGFEDFDGIV